MLGMLGMLGMLASPGRLVSAVTRCDEYLE